MEYQPCDEERRKTYNEQMTTIGIPADEVDSLGFQEFRQEGASIGPAGLVVR